MDEDPSTQPNIDFTEHFWNEDLVDNSGFERVCEQLDHGKRVCKGVADFIKVRISVEEEYARQLTKMIRHHGVFTDGTLGTSWQGVCSTTEEAVASHVKTVEALTQLHQKILEHIKQRKQQRKITETSLRKLQALQAEKKSMAEKVKKAKGDYWRKCEAIESFEYQVKTARADRNRLREVAKLERNVTKTQHAMTEMRRIYQTQLTNLNTVRNRWETETEKALLVFQRLEEQRISFLRQSLWLYSNILSVNCVEIDKHQQKLRGLLEDCSVSGDLALFINSKRTGKTRPGDVKFNEHRYMQTTVGTLRRSDSDTNKAQRSNTTTNNARAKRRQVKSTYDDPELQLDSSITNPSEETIQEDGAEEEPPRSVSAISQSADGGRDSNLSSSETTSSIYETQSRRKSESQSESRTEQDTIEEEVEQITPSVKSEKKSEQLPLYEAESYVSVPQLPIRKSKESKKKTLEKTSSNDSGIEPSRQDRETEKPTRRSLKLESGSEKRHSNSSQSSAQSPVSPGQERFTATDPTSPLPVEAAGTLALYPDGTIIVHNQNQTETETNKNVAETFIVKTKKEKKIKSMKKQKSQERFHVIETVTPVTSPPKVVKQSSQEESVKVEKKHKDDVKEDENRDTELTMGPIQKSPVTVFVQKSEEQSATTTVTVLHDLPPKLPDVPPPESDEEEETGPDINGNQFHHQSEHHKSNKPNKLNLRENPDNTAHSPSGSSIGTSGETQSMSSITSRDPDTGARQVRSKSGGSRDLSGYEEDEEESDGGEVGRAIDESLAALPRPSPPPTPPHTDNDNTQTLTHL